MKNETNTPPIPTYRTTDSYWAEWDDAWRQESAKVYENIRKLKAEIDAQKIPEENKKMLKGMINQIGKFIIEQGKQAGEHHFRELEYQYAVNTMNQERKIFKEIVQDLLKK